MNAQLCPPCRISRNHRTHRQGPARNPADPGATAQGMLREMAYVYHLTRTLKKAIMEEHRTQPSRN